MLGRGRRGRFASAGILALAVAFSGPGPLRADEPAADLATEIARVRVALERILLLLEQQVDNGGTELVFRRLDLIAREVAPLEAELNGLRTALVPHEFRLAGEADRLRSLQEQLAAGEVPEGESPETFRQRVEDASAQLAEQRQVVRSLRERLAALEETVAAKNAERDEWKRFLDRRLARAAP